MNEMEGLISDGLVEHQPSTMLFSFPPHILAAFQEMQTLNSTILYNLTQYFSHFIPYCMASIDAQKENVYQTAPYTKAQYTVMETDDLWCRYCHDYIIQYEQFK